VIAGATAAAVVAIVLGVVALFVLKQRTSRRSRSGSGGIVGGQERTISQPDKATNLNTAVPPLPPHPPRSQFHGGHSAQLLDLNSSKAVDSHPGSGYADQATGPRPLSGEGPLDMYSGSGHGRYPGYAKAGPPESWNAASSNAMTLEAESEQNSATTAAAASTDPSPHMHVRSYLSSV
jgi:hypothetical protein